MQPVFEGGCDAKVAAAASHAPEEITVFRIISRQQTAVRRTLVEAPIRALVDAALCSSWTRPETRRCCTALIVQ